MYRLRYNSRTFHIEGMTGRTCGTLTRYMNTLSTGAQTFEDAGAAVRNARIAARVNNMRVCANCEEYAEAESDTRPQQYTDALHVLDAGTDIQVYTFAGHTIAGKIADQGLTSVQVVSVQGDTLRIALADIESFEFFDEVSGDWVDPVEDARTETPAPEARRFVCLSCGAVDEGAACITGPVHLTPRRMLQGDFDRYMSSRRPVDKTEAVELRERIRAAREALAPIGEAAAERNRHLSPTAQAVVAASAVRDQAMADAHAAEGTDGEALADAVYAEADKAHRTAHEVHRHACDDYRAREAAAQATAALEFELADSEPARAQYLAARIAMAAENTLTSCDGSTMRPHVIAPAYLIAERLDLPANRFGVFVEGAHTVYADTLAEALTRIPEALAAVAASGEPGDHAATGCVAADLHECWSRALCEDDEPAPLAAPEGPAPALAAAVGAALTGEVETGAESVALVPIAKVNGNAVHGGVQAWDGMHPLCNTESSGWMRVGSAAITCGHCLKIIEKERIDDSGPVDVIVHRHTAVQRERERSTGTYPNARTRYQALDTPSFARFANLDEARAVLPELLAANDYPQPEAGRLLCVGDTVAMDDFTLSIREADPRITVEVPAAATELPALASVPGAPVRRFQVTITQTVTTVVYTDAVDPEAAVAAAVEELADDLYTLADAGGRTRDDDGREVERSLDDTYGEPEVRELDEYGCLVPTAAEENAAAAAFVRAITAGGSASV